MARGPLGGGLGGGGLGEVGKKGRRRGGGTKNKWEFPKMGGTLFWGPFNKDPTS